ncbi:MAG: alpha/beta fold hydrolase [Chloroflexota bacterium]|nr:alpha/beta fold hydrolase [Dehalococcoidia bacterium]MDW8254994.1 alpha/beta fold hydrolase [Chloroflexota bacterium]
MNVRGQLVRRLGIGIAASCAAGLGTAWLTRVRTDHLRSRPNPATTYDEAMARFQALAALDGPAVNPVCRSALLTHGRRVRRAIVFIHGMTNCPAQFEPLGRLFFERGYNVLLPRMPQNGYADRMTTALSRLTAEQLRDFADQIADIAAGLGEEAIVAGLSAGGVVAAWITQFRADIARTVLIAPSLGLGRYRPTLQQLLLRALLRVPNIQTQRLRPFEDGPPYSYYGYSTRALGEVLRLGLATTRAALQGPPAVQDVIVVTNANDAAVNNNVTRRLIALWQAQGLERVTSYDFPKRAGLVHDLIDIHQSKQRTDLVYPTLLDLIDRPAARV